MAPEQVKQGNSFRYVADVGQELDSAIFTFEVKQYPNADPVIEKEGSAQSGKIEFVLTPEETASLDVGLWYLVKTTTLAGWVTETTQRVQIVKAWS